MRIAHGHRDRGMSQDPLQPEDVAACHHVVTGEGVPENVGHLAWGIEAATLVGTAECRSTRMKQPTSSRHPHLEGDFCDLLGDRHRAGLAVLCAVEVGLPAEDGRTL